jgi:hypothetical protein
MNLNRLGSGRKLIQQVIKKTSKQNVPWNKVNQQKKILNQKNPNSPKFK